MPRQAITYMNTSDPLDAGQFILAFHSSTEILGVGICDLQNPKISRRIETFSLGKDLSKSLLICVNQLLPYKKWSRLARLAVATGPGGFTGTRLTVVMARTLAQQLNCPLDGVSSFRLMAPRLSASLESSQVDQPFWIVQQLKRRGVVAGCYRINREHKRQTYQCFDEIQSPRLFENHQSFSPVITATNDVRKDVNQLLEISCQAYQSRKESPWKNIVPIYPTSPVGNV